MNNITILISIYNTLVYGKTHHYLIVPKKPVFNNENESIINIATDIFLSANLL